MDLPGLWQRISEKLQASPSCRQGARTRLPSAA
jgi:hypothetical protein